MRFRKNLKRRDDAYKQWIEYEDARREGRQVRSATRVREPARPADLVSQRHYPQLEMRAVGASAGAEAGAGAGAGVGRLDPSLNIRSDLTGGASPEGDDRLRSISQVQIGDLYGEGGAKSQLRQLDRHSFTEGVGAGAGAGDVEEGDFVGDLPGAAGGAGAGGGNKHWSMPVKGKSASVFGSFNPLVMGGAGASDQTRAKAKPLTAAQLGGTVNPIAMLAGGGGGAGAKRLQFVTSPASPESLPPGMVSPAQSPELIEALDAIRLEETEFEDEDDDEDEEEGEEAER